MVATEVATFPLYIYSLNHCAGPARVITVLVIVLTERFSVLGGRDYGR